MKYCIKCGEQLSEEVQFCVNCGLEQPKLGGKKSEVSILKIPKQIKDPQMRIKYFRESISKNLIYGIIIVGFILLFLLYVFFQELLAIFWPYIIGIIIILFVVRLTIALIVALVERIKKN